MKTIKSIIASASLVAGTLSLNAAVLPNFELYNKTDDSVIMTVSNVKTRAPGFASRIVVKAGDNFQTNILISEPTEIEFLTATKKVIGQYSVKKLQDRTKTVYVSLGRKAGKGDIKLYPQTGKGSILVPKMLKVTETNLPLKNNIEATDITEIIPFQPEVPKSYPSDEELGKYIKQESMEEE